MESLVSDFPAGEGKPVSLFYSVSTPQSGINKLHNSRATEQQDNIGIEGKSDVYIVAREGWKDR
jgi:hypothetical protein